MFFVSTNKTSPEVTFRQAVLQGLAPDGGLYMPKSFPVLSKERLNNFKGCNFSEIAAFVVSQFIGEEISQAEIKKLCTEAFNFPTVLKPILEKLYVLELFHGPTLAFKDYGARFMSRVMERLVGSESRETILLAATSGDTGGAVADGFLGIPNIRVVVLYPSGKVSRLQEQQFATLGSNISAFEVQGTFDDCQRMVKECFLDAELSARFNLASANSINIARLLPQMLYYFFASTRAEITEPPIFVVPSGNYGNLTAGLFAKQMGAEIRHFVAATNSNDVLPEMLRTGSFRARPSVQTISNAMDVGNPSNIARIIDLFNGDISKIRQLISPYSFSDLQTAQKMKAVFQESNYLVDPHTAVGLLGADAYRREHGRNLEIVLSTARPAKFHEVVDNVVGVEPPIPESLRAAMNREKLSRVISPKVAELKMYL